MTKEELDIQKEIGNYFTESTGFGRDKIKNFIDIVNKALKQKGERIAELEQKLEQTEKDLADYQFNYPKIKELEKENAELDMKRKAERQIFQGIVEKKNEQLTKAKEIIKTLADDLSMYSGNYQKELLEAEQFLKESE